MAANTRGIALVRGLIAEYSLPVVQAYMAHIQANAEAAVRDMLVAFSAQQVGPCLQHVFNMQSLPRSGPNSLVVFSAAQGLAEVGAVRARDQMDDGTPICLSVGIDRRDGSAVFDFEGAGSGMDFRGFKIKIYAGHASWHAKL